MAEGGQFSRNLHQRGSLVKLAIPAKRFISDLSPFFSITLFLSLKFVLNQVYKNKK